MFELAVPKLVTNVNWCLLRVIINQHHSEILSVFLTASLRRHLGCTQLNTCTVLYNMVTLFAEFVTCLLSPSLSPLHLLGIPCKSEHLFCHYTQLTHSVTALLLVNLLVVLQAHNGFKYEHSLLYEITQKTTIMTGISNMDNTIPIHYLLQSFKSPFSNNELKLLSIREIKNIINSLKLKNCHG